MSPLRKFLRAGAVMVAGLFVLGVTVDAVEEPAPPEPVVKTVVKYKYKTVTKPYIPSACVDALKLAEQIQTSAYAVSDTSNAQLDILSDAQIAIFNRSSKEATKAAEDQDALTRKTTGAILDLAENQEMYQTAREDCARTVLD